VVKYWKGVTGKLIDGDAAEFACMAWGGTIEVAKRDGTAVVLRTKNEIANTTFAQRRPWELEATLRNLPFVERWVLRKNIGESIARSPQWKSSRRTGDHYHASCLHLAGELGCPPKSRLLLVGSKGIRVLQRDADEAR
jgi:hypothetical protein